MKHRTYIAIDLKSFYASVECQQRHLDPLDTYLVVADESRTDKTICLAVTPALKSYGLRGRGRLFEVRQRIKDENHKRRARSPHHSLIGSTHSHRQLLADHTLAIDFLIAPPRMALYLDYSTRIYNVYTKTIAPKDIVVYSIDEVFIDATDYLTLYNLSAHQLAKKIIQDVLSTTGITATAGIGTNLFLAKVAMDIVAKKCAPDTEGVRIATLDEHTFRETLWTHRPLTDFWRIGKGVASRLEHHGLFTMGDIARCSIRNEELLYRTFGKNAELIIDHAWGWEPCTIEAIKAYRPAHACLTSGQVLHEPYSAPKAKLVIREMADQLALDLVEKNLLTRQLVLTIGYDILNLSDPKCHEAYQGEVVYDAYGRPLPKHAHTTINLPDFTSSSTQLMQAVSEAFDRIVNPALLIRRLNLSANQLSSEAMLAQPTHEQLDLFTDYAALEAKAKEEKAKALRENNVQKTLLAIKQKFGKNAILRAMSLEDGATARERNEQIGGHKA